EQNEGLAYTTRVNCAETTITLCADNISAHNVYYVKWRGVTRKSLVIYVKTEKAFSPMPFIVYVVHF
ncbi:hypothetical protein VC902_24155, partial [Citrobacter freundii]|nr:hypothetical protein [Citrobacter freundii]